MITIGPHSKNSFSYQLWPLKISFRWAARTAVELHHLQNILGPPWSKIQDNSPGMELRMSRSEWNGTSVALWKLELCAGNPGPEARVNSVRRWQEPSSPSWCHCPSTREWLMAEASSHLSRSFCPLGSPWLFQGECSPVSGPVQYKDLHTPWSLSQIHPCAPSPDLLVPNLRDFPFWVLVYVRTVYNLSVT